MSVIDWEILGGTYAPSPTSSSSGPSIVQMTTPITNSPSNPEVVQLPGTAKVGNTLVVVAQQNDAASAPTGWTLAHALNDIRIYTSTATGTSSDQCSLATSGGDFAAFICEIQGLTKGVYGFEDGSGTFPGNITLSTPSLVFFAYDGWTAPKLTPWLVMDAYALGGRNAGWIVSPGPIPSNGNAQGWTTLSNASGYPTSMVCFAAG
jgi:hypothetical protein